MLKMVGVETFYGKVKALHGVSLDVKEGQLVTILGANGAGKSTILKTISGLVEPENGTIHFNDIRIDRKDPEDIVAMGISHVPEWRRIFPELTVYENRSEEHTSELQSLVNLVCRLLLEKKKNKTKKNKIKKKKNKMTRSTEQHNLT